MVLLHTQMHLLLRWRLLRWRRRRMLHRHLRWLHCLLLAQHRCLLSNSSIAACSKHQPLHSLGWQQGTQEVCGRSPRQGVAAAWPRWLAQRQCSVQQHRRCHHAARAAPQRARKRGQVGSKLWQLANPRVAWRGSEASKALDAPSASGVVTTKPGCVLPGRREQQAKCRWGRSVRTAGCPDGPISARS